MAQHVTESIWHFAGYFHLAEFTSFTPVHFLGAPQYHNPGYEPGDGASVGAAPRLMLPQQSRPVVFAEPSLPAELQRPGLPPADFSIASPGAIAALPFRPELTQRDPIQSDQSFDASPPDLKVKLTYTEIPGYLASIDVFQQNILFDGDSLLGDVSKLLDGTGVPADAAPVLARMIADAEELIPANVFPDFNTGGDNGNARIGVSGDPAPIDTGGSPGAVAGTAAETSHTVNGVRVDDPNGSPNGNAAIAAQVDDIQDAIEGFNPDEGEPQSPEPVVLEDGRQSIHAESDGMPTGGYAQETVTGAGEALNVAVLDDRSDAFASLVIEGDYHETNAIVQINVLSDDDVLNVTSAAAAQEIASGRNTLTNDAHFVADPGSIVGDGMSGFSGSLNWQVTYVTGDYWDIVALSQRNVLIDGDLAQQTSTNTHMTAVLGSNGQLNFIEFTQASPEFDLIIIGGDYYDFNTILQINLVMDDDAVLQVLGGPGGQSSTAGGNTLLNDAAIVSIGSENFLPLDGNAAKLAEAVADQEEIADATLTLGVPAIGPGPLKVLYVAGDYYDLDLIVQTNVILDPDAIEQAALEGAQENGGVGEEDLDQYAVAGGNQAFNLALLIDADSLSGYQYLGGEEYEETLLVQANIVSDDDDIASSRDLHPDVIAAVAAMSEADGGNSGPGSRDDHLDHPIHNVDILGGVMT